MDCPPVVLLCFTRPEGFTRVLEQVRLAAPADLFIGSDGPRRGRSADADDVARVRALIEQTIDWPCNVRRYYRDTNVGVGANSELTFDAAFAEVDRAVIFDDDCVPHQSFFRFCAELLELYADDDRVAHIAGCNEEVPATMFNGNSYAFTTWGSNWGWASWARAWHAHRRQFPRPHDSTTARVPDGANGRTTPVAEPRSLSPARPADLLTASGRRFFADVGAAQAIELAEWGQQWRLSMINQGGLAITPAVNLIENIGFAPGSDSGMPTRDMQQAGEMPFPLRHPSDVEIDPRVQRVLERNMVRAVGRLARLVRARTPQSLRKSARRIGGFVVRGGSLS